MELYFKDFISEEATLEKLVDDLALVVHGAEHFAQAVGAPLSEQSRNEVASRLARLKTGCQRLREETLAKARATDRLMRANPYSSLGMAFALGLIVGARWLARRPKSSDSSAANFADER